MLTDQPHARLCVRVCNIHPRATAGLPFSVRLYKRAGYAECLKLESVVMQMLLAPTGDAQLLNVFSTFRVSVQRAAQTSPRNEHADALRVMQTT